ncbi:MAG: trimeric intracellular cation channel family protein [Propionibacteriaceae bacterium]|mgnify:CR=1 FL=1|nr:trimeric intracellular cation channel family protein [Propionibacteriaceae bacterium]
MVLTVLSIIGIIAGSMSGALAAGKERMDLFGVVMVGFVTALGGGTIRDVFLDIHPLVWVGEPLYCVLVVVASVITVWVARTLQYFWALFLWLDALGLVAFSILGAQAALHHNLGIIVAGASAIITGSVGGIMRDLLCDRIPLVFREELYGSVSLFVGMSYVGLLSAGLSSGLAVTISLLSGFALRVAAIQWKITLPVFDYQEESYYDRRKALRTMMKDIRWRWNRRNEAEAKAKAKKRRQKPKPQL